VAGGNPFELKLYSWLRELVKLRDVFMADPATAKLLAVLSPGGFTLDEKEGFRTVTTDCVFNGLYEAAAVLVKDGVTDGIRTRDSQIHNLERWPG